MSANVDLHNTIIYGQEQLANHRSALYAIANSDNLQSAKKIALDALCGKFPATFGESK